MPAGTSVLVTAGIAIALGIPTVVLAQIGAQLPYLIEGSVGNQQVKVRLHLYDNIHDIEQMITNDGLRLFGEEPR